MHACLQGLEQCRYCRIAGVQQKCTGCTFRKAGSGWWELSWCGWRKDAVGYLYGNSREHHTRCMPCEWRVQRAQLYVKFILTLRILWMGLGSPPQGSTGHSLRNTHPGEQDHRQLGQDPASEKRSWFPAPYGNSRVTRLQEPLRAGQWTFQRQVWTDSQSPGSTSSLLPLT